MANMFTGDNDHSDAVPPTDILLQMIKQLRTERDEARRMYCDLVSKDIYHRTAGATCKNAANNLGWDCYKSDTLSQEVSQEGDKLPATISANGIRITEYLPPQKSVREIPPHAAYTTGECTLHNISVDKSYEKILDKHNDLFQKLAQEEKTNG